MFPTMNKNPFSYHFWTFFWTELKSGLQGCSVHPEPKPKQNGPDVRLANEVNHHKMTTPKAKEVGLVFPPDPRKAGERGSTYGNKEVWANAVQAVSPSDAEKIRKERQWRKKYQEYVVCTLRGFGKSFGLIGNAGWSLYFVFFIVEMTWNRRLTDVAFAWPQLLGALGHGNGG